MLLRHRWAASVFVVALGFGCNLHRNTSGEDAAASLTSAVASVAAPVPAKDSGMVTDYTSLREAKRDGAAAIGKTILITVTRERLWADRVSLHTCANSEPASTQATYTPDMRPLLRGMLGMPGDRNCHRVIVRWTGKEERGTDLVNLLEVLDVKPYEPQPPPPGVDYTSMDDALIEGASAAGKVVQTSVSRQGGSSPPNAFIAHMGDVFGVGVEIHYRPDQAEAVKKLPEGEGHYEPVTFKLKKSLNHEHTVWAADLIAVGR